MLDIAGEGSMTDCISLESLLNELRDLVQEAKHALDDEIRAYPTPIPRCDAQFNHLYEQRSRLTDVVARINAISAAPDDRELMQFLAGFTASAPFTDDASERALRARVRSALARSSSQCVG
jgi:chorismate mutase